MDFQFLPLEIWRASSLAQETKAVVAAFERCVATGDNAGMNALKTAILQRIEDLELFYVQNVDDDRSVLFEKQRLKLRKLLADYSQASAHFNTSNVTNTNNHNNNNNHYQSHSYPSNARPAAPVATFAAQEPQRYQPPEPVFVPQTSQVTFDDNNNTGNVVMRAIRIAEDTRLNKDELVACFAQALGAEMPEVSPEVVEAVFETVTKTNLDGKMSVRDLRQWYITFGKRALREGIHLDSDGGIVSAALVAKHGFAHSRKNQKHTSNVSTSRPLYSWETNNDNNNDTNNNNNNSNNDNMNGPSPVSNNEPVALPHGMLEFQVRLTPEEWSLIQLKKRQLEAEERYRSRLTSAKEKNKEKDYSIKIGKNKKNIDNDNVEGSRSAFLYSTQAQTAHAGRFYNGSNNQSE